MAATGKGQPASPKGRFGEAGSPRKQGVGHHAPGRGKESTHVPLPSDKKGKTNRPSLKAPR